MPVRMAMAAPMVVVMRVVGTVPMIVVVRHARVLADLPLSRRRGDSGLRFSDRRPKLSGAETTESFLLALETI
jgi:hypothetical protein